jgi:hypothetical protein
VVQQVRDQFGLTAMTPSSLSVVVDDADSAASVSTSPYAGLQLDITGLDFLLSDVLDGSNRDMTSKDVYAIKFLQSLSKSQLQFFYLSCL